MTKFGKRMKIGVNTMGNWPPANHDIMTTLWKVVLCCFSNFVRM